MMEALTAALGFGFTRMGLHSVEGRRLAHPFGQHHAHLILAHHINSKKYSAVAPARAIKMMVLPKR